MSKVLSLEELNNISKISISKFIEDKASEGWWLFTETENEAGLLRVYKDNENVKYVIRYIKDDTGSWQPEKLLRICDIVIKM